MLGMYYSSAIYLAGVTFHESKAASVQHADGSSTLMCSDGTQLHSAFVLDCTGHARKLVTFDQKFDPGYQAAYGMMIEVESHPFELDTMLFMDWRDDHTKVCIARYRHALLDPVHHQQPMLACEAYVAYQEKSRL